MDQRRAEELLLAFFGNLATSGISDRRPTGSHEVHHETGLPTGALAPETMAVGGKQLALEFHLVPRAFAAGCLRREIVNPEGDREQIALVTVPEASWTSQERVWADEMTRLVKLAAHRLHERAGWFNVQPEDHVGAPMPLGPDGLCMGIKIRSHGLEAAIQLVRARPDLTWRRLTPEADFGRVLWSTSPSHLRSRYEQWGRQAALT